MIQMVSMVIGFIVALIVAFLTHRRPEKNWEWISTGGFYFLLILSGTAAQYERSLRSPLDDYVYVCSDGVTYPRIPIFVHMDENFDCRQIRTTPEPSFGGMVGMVWDLFKDTLISAWLDVPGDILGLYAGISLAGGKPPSITRSLKDLINPPPHA